MQASIVQLAVFSVGAMSLLIALIGLIALLSIMRRVRISRTEQSVVIAPMTIPTRDRSAIQFNAFTADTIEVLPTTTKAFNAPAPLPVSSRKVISDHATIMIEPDRNPTPRRRAQRSQIERLITHLETPDTQPLDSKAG